MTFCTVIINNVLKIKHCVFIRTISDIVRNNNCMIEQKEGELVMRTLKLSTTSMS